MLAPIAIVLLTSLKPGNEVIVSSFSLLPKRWRFDNYVTAFSKGGWGRYYFNSLYVTVVAVAGSLSLNSLAGYSFTRLAFPAKNLIFMLLLAGIMIPPQSIIIPQFLILKGIPLAGGDDLLGRGGRGLLNTRWALIVPELSGSFGIFLCRQFYLGFPRSLDEAARIDGATSLATFTRVFLPSERPHPCNARRAQEHLHVERLLLPPDHDHLARHVDRATHAGQFPRREHDAVGDPDGRHTGLDPSHRRGLSPARRSTTYAALSPKGSRGSLSRRYPQERLR